MRPLEEEALTIVQVAYRDVSWRAVISQRQPSCKRGSNMALAKGLANRTPPPPSRKESLRSCSIAPAILSDAPSSRGV